MKIIGLTGGIGSGKSTVAREFEKLGVPIYIADERSKHLLANDKAVIQSVTELLGSNAYTEVDDKKVPNRKFIASQVFSDKILLQELNSILHPAVRRDFDRFSTRHNDSKFIIYEAAILFESGGNSICDKTILVTALKEDRITRVMLRDGVEADEVRQRMNHQWSEKKKLLLSDYVIYNEIHDLIPALVRNVYRFMLIS